MAEGNGGTGRKRPGPLDRVREDAAKIKTLVQEKGKEELAALKEPDKTQLYRSIFRVKHDETPRSRSLGVLSNVFLHLHPAKINRDAVHYKLHLGHGRHHLLPVHRPDLYRRPADVLLPPDQGAGLPRHSVSGERRALRQAAAQHAPLGRAPDDHRRLAAHVPRVPDRLVQAAARIQLVHRRAPDGADDAAVVHRLPAAGRSAGFLGRHRGHEHGARHSGARP